MTTPMPDFLARAASLPTLGLGVSTEYGARRQAGALDPAALREQQVDFAQFLEVGVEIVKGLDADAQAWAAQGWPTTYHFLDVNLDEPEDFDAEWLAALRATVEVLAPAWLCGDAGLWHFGVRDRGQMLLLPPVLEREAVAPMAAGIQALREATGLEVLPENPPGAVFLGRMHLLEFFARTAEAADTGLLLDCAHLAMFQRARGLAPLAGFDDFAWDRVIELHVAGGRVHERAGLQWVEDDHGVEVLPDTWTIVEAALARAVNLRAVVVECERNSIPAVLPLFRQVQERLPARLRTPIRPSPTPKAERPAVPATSSAGRVEADAEFEPQRIQRSLVCMLFDPRYAAKIRGGDPLPELRERERELLREVGPRGLATDEMRRARALQVLLDEYPVSAALLGLDLVDRFFASAEFRACVLERGSMALAFGQRWLRDRARGVGMIETAMARARRDPRRPDSLGAAGPGALGRAPGVIPLRVPEGSLAWYRRARERLGPEPVQALAKLRKPWAQTPPRRGEEHLLVEPQADGSLAIATASKPLVELLYAADPPRARPELARVAVELGAEAHEADELLDDLLAEGLLA
jgi:uncharacterized protein